LTDKLDALGQGHVSPVNTVLVIAVVWAEEMLEDLSLILGDVVGCIVMTVRSGAVCSG
jgi:hypothetical protein